MPGTHARRNSRSRTPGALICAVMAAGWFGAFPRGCAAARGARPAGFFEGAGVLGFAICLFAFVVICTSAQAQCRQALALGLDVSGSVDEIEYRLQMQGLGNALRDAEVRTALLAHPAAPVDIAVFEWSAPEYQRLIIGWTTIADAATLDQVARRISQTPRQPAPPVTGLGQAMVFGRDLLRQRSACWKRTLDISGDGRSNSGVNPADVKPTLSGLTLNALVIGADAPHGGDLRQVQIAELSAYFRALVISGPDAFVETALGFEGYQEAMTRKLLRELQGLAVSSLVPHTQRRPQ